MASQSSAANGIPLGQQKPASTWGEYNKLMFVVQQALGRMQTATLVRVDAVTNSGGVSPVGLVDITPLVNQIDGQGVATPHVTIHNVPYLRIQGGTNAIILDPQVGDIGLCVFASRDISKVKATRKRANPGSFRQYSFSDGMYLGGMLNAAPTQYVQFSAAGITLHSPVAVTLEAPVVVINAGTSTTITTPLFVVNGNSVFNGGFSQTEGGGVAEFASDVVAMGTSVHTHVHTGVQTGPSNTGTPA